MALYFTTLPSDLHILLFLYFSSQELLQILPELSKYQIILKKDFWKTIWKRDISSFIEPSENYAEIRRKYAEIFSTLNSFTERLDIFVFLTKNGYDILLYPLLMDTNYNLYIMRIASEAGHIQILEKLLDCTKNMISHDYDDLMICAAQNGDIEIVKLMIKIGATSFDYAMSSTAAHSGNIEIIDLMLEKGARDYFLTLKSAVRGNNRKIVKKMLELIDQNIEKYNQKTLLEDFNNCIKNARENKNQSIAKLVKKYRDKHIKKHDGSE